MFLNRKFSVCVFAISFLFGVFGTSAIKAKSAVSTYSNKTYVLGHFKSPELSAPSDFGYDKTFDLFDVNRTGSRNYKNEDTFKSGQIGSKAGKIIQVAGNKKKKKKKKNPVRSIKKTTKKATSGAKKAAEAAKKRAEEEKRKAAEALRKKREAAKRAAQAAKRKAADKAKKAAQAAKRKAADKAKKAAHAAKKKAAGKAKKAAGDVKKKAKKQGKKAAGKAKKAVGSVKKSAKKVKKKVKKKAKTATKAVKKTAGKAAAAATAAGAAATAAAAAIEKSASKYVKAMEPKCTKAIAKKSKQVASYVPPGAVAICIMNSSKNAQTFGNCLKKNAKKAKKVIKNQNNANKIFSGVYRDIKKDCAKSASKFAKAAQKDSKGKIAGDLKKKAKKTVKKAKKKTKKSTKKAKKAVGGVIKKAKKKTKKSTKKAKKAVGGVIKKAKKKTKKAAKSVEKTAVKASKTAIAAAAAIEKSATKYVKAMDPKCTKAIASKAKQVASYVPQGALAICIMDSSKNAKTFGNCLKKKAKKAKKAIKDVKNADKIFSGVYEDVKKECAKSANQFAKAAKKDSQGKIAGKVKGAAKTVSSAATSAVDTLKGVKFEVPKPAYAAGNCASGSKGKLNVGYCQYGMVNLTACASAAGKEYCLGPGELTTTVKGVIGITTYIRQKDGLMGATLEAKQTVEMDFFGVKIPVGLSCTFTQGAKSEWTQTFGIEYTTPPIPPVTSGSDVLKDIIKKGKAKSGTAKSSAVSSGGEDSASAGYGGEATESQIEKLQELSGCEIVMPEMTLFKGLKEFNLASAGVEIGVGVKNWKVKGDMKAPADIVVSADLYVRAGISAAVGGDSQKIAGQKIEMPGFEWSQDFGDLVSLPISSGRL